MFFFCLQELSLSVQEGRSVNTDYYQSRASPPKNKSPSKKALAAMRRQRMMNRHEYNCDEVIEMLKAKQCKYCSQRFRHKNNGGLIQHVRLHHMDIPLNVCYHCRQIFPSKKEHSHHRKTCRLTCREMHGCTMCDENDDENNELEESTVQFKFTCTLCETDNMFETVEEWTSHRTTHELTGADQYKCDECPEDFQNEVDLEDHKRNHEIVGSPDEDGDDEPMNDENDKDEVNGEEVKEESQEDGNAELSSTQESASGDSRPRRDKNYKCSDCNKVFYHPQRYAAHKKSHKASTPPIPSNSSLICRTCNKRFQYPSKLKEHIKGCERRHSAPILIKTLMQTPKQEFSKLVIPHSATRFIDADGNGSCPYKNCDKQFQNKFSLYKHMLRCTLKPRDFEVFTQIHPEAVKCPKCRRFFISQKSYNRHITLGQCGHRPLIVGMQAPPLDTSGYEENDFEASNDTPFDDNFSFEMIHNGAYQMPTNDSIALIPNESNTFTCESCNKTTQSKSGMVEHRKYCHFRLTSCCINCNLPFNDIESFRTHYTEEHAARNTSVLPIPLECKKCNKLFNNLRSYRLHMIKQHQLQISNRNLSTGYTDLGAHLVQFECEYCHKMFASRSSMRKHIRKVCQVARAQQGDQQHPMDLLEIEPYIEVGGDAMNMRDDDDIDDADEDGNSSSILCAVCNTHFENIGELRQHILVKHKPAAMKQKSQRTYFCEYCKMAFNEETDLKEHFANYHNIDNDVSAPPSPDGLLMEVTPDIMHEDESESVEA